jgi:hypothetical protein
MSIDFYQLMKNHNIHSQFLNESGIVKALEESYKMGTSDVLEWLSKMDYLSDNIQYIKEEWENQNK